VCVVDDSQRQKRAGTVIEPTARGLGSRNEDHSHIPTPPRGVGLTQPPIVTLRKPAPPQPVVPRREFDFEQKTPPAMDPNTYHALQTMRAEMLNVVSPILELVNAREEREAKEREQRRKYIVPIIAALGVAIAGIVAAALHGCAS